MSKLNTSVISLLGMVALLIAVSACGGNTPADTLVPTEVPATSIPEVEGVPEKTATIKAIEAAATTQTLGPATPVGSEVDEEDPKASDKVEAEETPNNQGPTLLAEIVSGDIAGAGKPFTFDATQSAAGDLPIEAYEWDMGDGTFLFGLAIQHAYREPGEYTVTLTIVDEAGMRETTEKVVEIVSLEELATPTAVSENPTMVLIGSSWLMDQPLRGTIITLNIDEETVSGSSGCNSYNATYSIIESDGGTTSISVGAISGTSQTCTQEIMAQERAYLDLLASTSSYQIIDEKLILETGIGPLTFSPAGQ